MTHLFLFVIEIEIITKASRAGVVKEYKKDSQQVETRLESTEFEQNN